MKHNTPPIIKICKQCGSNKYYAKCLCKACYLRQWHLKNQKSEILKSRQHYWKNRTIINAQCREWRRQHPNYWKKKTVKDQQKQYTRERYSIDLQFRLRLVLRARFNHAIRNNHKKGSAIHNLGCSILKLKSYLELKFLPGMSWENWGRDGWHIDHIKPLSSFDLMDPQQLRKACHYTNLQPLWAKDNLSKGGKLL